MPRAPVSTGPDPCATGSHANEALADGARVDLLVTSGWCPFAVELVGAIQNRLREVTGEADPQVDIRWDEAWTTDRLSPDARQKLRFLPPPRLVRDRREPSRRSPPPSPSRPSPKEVRPMIDDALVFDCVAHVFNFDESNCLGSAGKMFNNHLYAFHSVLTPGGETHLTPEQYLRTWTPEEIDHMVFDESDTDMLLAMPLPLTDMFKDGPSPWRRCAELAQLRPDRTILWGFINPLEGRAALDLMEVQVKEFGARAFKLYNTR